MAKGAVVPDTSLLLYLGRIGHLGVLPHLFSEVCVPEQVAFELDVGRMLREDTVNPGTLNWATIVRVSEEEIDSLPPNQLGAGERSVIAYARSHTNCTAGLDDRQARQMAERIGLAIVGTIGVLIRAKHNGLIGSVRTLLDACRDEGFRINPEVYREALRLAGEGDLIH